MAGSARGNPICSWMERVPTDQQRGAIGGSTRKDSHAAGTSMKCRARPDVTSAGSDQGHHGAQVPGCDVKGAGRVLEHQLAPSLSPNGMKNQPVNAPAPLKSHLSTFAPRWPRSPPADVTPCVPCCHPSWCFSLQLPSAGQLGLSPSSCKLDYLWDYLPLESYLSHHNQFCSIIILVSVFLFWAKVLCYCTQRCLLFVFSLPENCFPLGFLLKCCLRHLFA